MYYLLISIKDAIFLSGPEMEYSAHFKWLFKRRTSLSERSAWDIDSSNDGLDMRYIKLKFINEFAEPFVFN